MYTKKERKKEESFIHKASLNATTNKTFKKCIY